MATLILFTVLLLLILIFYMFHCFINREFYRKASKIPSPKCYPFIGNCYLFFGNSQHVFKLMAKFKRKFGRMYAIWIGPWLNVCVFSARDAEIILKESRNMPKSYHYKYLKPWLGDSILLSNGEKFRRNKKIVVQSFHTNNLKEYSPIFNRQSINLIEDLQQYVDNQQFDIYKILNRYTMYTLLETTLDVDPSTMSPEDVQNYAAAVEEIRPKYLQLQLFISILFKFRVGYCGFIRSQRPWLFPDCIFYFSALKRRQDKALNVLNKFTNLVINKRRQEYKNSKQSNRQSKTKFLDRFFEIEEQNGCMFSADEIKDEVMTIMFAGQDTTTTTIAFALSLLGYYKEIQERVVDELKTVLNNLNLISIKHDDLQKMKYLERVIQETWRLFPPIPGIAKALNHDIKLDDLIIPKDSTITISIMSIHYDSGEYPEPYRFNPDNFLPEQIQQRHPYSFLPFSANYRQCIGNRYAMMIVKIFLARILIKYEIHSTTPPNKYKLATQTVLKRKDGHFICIKERL